MPMFFLLLFLASCSSTNEVIRPDPIIPEKNINDKESRGVRVGLTLSSFDKTQSDRLFKIKNEVERILNSPEFRARVLSFYTNGKKKFNETDDSNEKVYEVLTSKPWDVKIELARGKRNVLGWTNPSTPWIWFNSRYFNGREDSGLAGTFCHEMAHKFGFGHAFRNYRGREYTVPYGVGTICANLYQL